MGVSAYTPIIVPFVIPSGVEGSPGGLSYLTTRFYILRCCNYAETFVSING